MSVSARTSSSVSSNLARKFEFLQDRAQRKPIHESTSTMPTPGADDKKKSISHLKDFYLQRLAKSEPGAAARLGGKPQGTAGAGYPAAQPAATGQHVARPTPCAGGGGCSGAGMGAPQDIEDLEVMCNNCFNLIKSSEASLCTGDAATCSIAQKAGTGGAERPSGQVALLDLKLRKLRLALEGRLQDSSSKVTVMRHLTQLRYHIDTAAKWTPGCAELGALSDHTVQQAKQLTATSRVIAPAVYIFSKRIENVIVQKERELRKLLMQEAGTGAAAGKGPGGVGGVGAGGGFVTLDGDRDQESIADVNSVVSELDSDCGTQYAETMVTQDGALSSDVGNVQDANEYLSLKSEDEQRRWFYSQCLTVKLACTDKARARKTLISDLYAKVRADGVPIEGWSQWIKVQLGA